MREPGNSWEVSYVMLYKKPHLKVDVTYNQLVSRLDHSRMRELRNWADENFSYKWFTDHI